MTEDRPAGYRLTFAVLASGLIVFALLQSMVAPLLSVLQHDLHTTQNTVTWVLTAYLLSASVATPILGRFGDKYGKEKMLLVTLGALGIGCLLAVFATSIGVMIAARAIQGIGGGIMPLSFGIVRDEFPKETVAGVIGFLAALLGVGVGTAS
jgi:MFS family permease